MRLVLLLIAVFLGMASFAYAHPGHDHEATTSDSLGVTVEGVDPGEVGVEVSVDADGGVSAAHEAQEGGQGAHGEVELGISGRIEEGGLSETEKQSLISLDSQGIVMIKSEADVTTYADIVAEESVAVHSIAVSNEAIVVSYMDTGKLFGFIPLATEGSVSVQKDGAVRMGAPWYVFLMSGLSSTEIEAQVTGDLSGKSDATEAAFTATTEAALQARAEIIRAVTSAIEASVEAKAAVAAE